MKIPLYAKEEAREALELRETLPVSEQFGLSEEEARVLGITSGISRAQQLIKSNRLSEEDKKAVCRFYTRFRNKKGERAEGAIKLWGGRKFGKKVCKSLK